MGPEICSAARSPTTSCGDQTNTHRRLSELQGDDVLILTLPRGHLCPKWRRPLMKKVGVPERSSRRCRRRQPPERRQHGRAGRRAHVAFVSRRVEHHEVVDRRPVADGPQGNAVRA
jgi:hypothetical protein